MADSKQHPTCYDCGEPIVGTPVEIRWSDTPWMAGPLVCEDCAIDFEEVEGAR